MFITSYNTLPQCNVIRWNMNKKQNNLVVITNHIKNNFKNFLSVWFWLYFQIDSWHSNNTMFAWLKYWSAPFALVAICIGNLKWLFNVVDVLQSVYVHAYNKQYCRKGTTGSMLPLLLPFYYFYYMKDSALALSILLALTQLNFKLRWDNMFHSVKKQRGDIESERLENNHQRNECVIDFKKSNG